MTIDPSSIPNFGGQPEPQPQGPAGPVVPDQDLVKQLLDQMELKYVVDDEGDLAAPWEEFRTYFMFRGEGDQAVYSVRTFFDRPHQIDEKPQLLEAIDDWNRRTLWPKVYTHTHDDGTVRLIGETQMLIGSRRQPRVLRLLDGELGARVDRVRQVARGAAGPGSRRRPRKRKRTSPRTTSSRPRHAPGEREPGQDRDPEGREPGPGSRRAGWGRCDGLSTGCGRAERWE